MLSTYFLPSAAQKQYIYFLKYTLLFYEEKGHWSLVKLHLDVLGIKDPTYWIIYSILVTEIIITIKEL